LPYCNTDQTAVNAYRSTRVCQVISSEINWNDNDIADEAFDFIFFSSMRHVPTVHAKYNNNGNMTKVVKT